MAPQPCLYCEKPAESLEHFLPSGIGGVLKLPILCDEHNQHVARHCDDPLCKQMTIFVNALRVVKARGEDGVPIAGKTVDGAIFTVDRDQRPQVSAQIIERDALGRPAKAQFPTMEAAEKLVRSMGLSPEDPGVILQKERLPGPTIEFTPAFGGPDGFRGILKIAYEYARGVLGASVVDATCDDTTRQAILAGGAPAHFVRWLPYERLPAGEVAFYSHRLAAWQSENEVLVIVELFNTLPFVVRLPGLELRVAACYFQGIKGEQPLRGLMPLLPQWSWDDIPEHAQAQMLSGVEQRMGDIQRTRQAAEYLLAARDLLAEALRDQTASATDEQLLGQARVEIQQWNLTADQFRILDSALVAFLATFRAGGLLDG